MLHRLSLPDSAATFANLGFLGLFPAFFFWHFALAAGTNPIEIGLFREISVIVAAAFLSLFFMRWVNKAMRSPLAVLTLAFMLYCGVSTVFHMFGSEVPEGSVAQAGTLVVSWFCLLSLGAFMDINNPKFQKLLALSWLAMASVVLIYVQGLHFIPREIFDTKIEFASYQGFSRSFVFASMVLLALQRTTWQRVIFAAFAIAIAFLMAARSELIGLIFAVVLVEFIRASRTLQGLTLLAILCLVAGLVPFFADYGALTESRQMQLLDLSKSTSWTIRTEYAISAWEQIVASPISGQFGGHFLVGTPDGGSYAHNALSCWVSFGLIGFVLYVGITLAATVISLVGFCRSMDSEWQLSLYLNASALLMIAFTKPVFWPFVALGWGLCIAKSSKRKVARFVPHRNPLTEIARPSSQLSDSRA